MNPIFTIGHSQHKLEHFLAMLRCCDINYVIDVRSTPYSKYAQDYDKERIKEFLVEHGIHYVYMGKHFGARQEDRSLYTPEGYLDFKRAANSPHFQEGLENVMKGMENNRIALMCLEKKPIDCHRAILVANAFYQKGCSVSHILEDCTIQRHEELNEELLEMYFPDRNQVSLFDTRTEEEYLSDAYSLRNKQIGYNILER